MNTYMLLQELSKNSNFRLHVQKVFEILNQKYNITFQEIIDYLNMGIIINNFPETNPDYGDQTRLYHITYPCNYVKFRNIYTFSIFNIDSETIITIPSFKYDTSSDHPKVFGMYDFLAAMRDNYQGTVEIFKEIL